MCGLFGWQLSPEAMAKGDVHTLAVILALHSEKRGDESWGVVMHDLGTKGPEIMKNTGSIKKTCKIKNIIAPQVIGHTRKATTGKISVENAHPFTWNGIVGSHNGFVYDHMALNKKYNRDFEVDSQHLIAHIAEGRPLTELGGSGTASYLKLAEPNVVLLGRGTGSDLTVCAIGPRNKPIGVVWASLNYYVQDALEMAGFGEYYTITTAYRRLYRVEKFDVFDEGEFDFGPSYGRVRQIAQNDYREVGTGNQTYGGECAGHSYRGRTQFDYDHTYNPNKGLTTITKSDIDALPEHLKKNPQERSLAQGETKQANAPTLECSSCGDFGRVVTSFEEDADGVMHFASIDEDLCQTCATFWGSISGQYNPGRRITNVVVPNLSIVPRSRGKEGEPCSKPEPVANSQPAPTQQPNKE